jgi:hypothetical protein
MKLDSHDRKVTERALNERQMCQQFLRLRRELYCSIADKKIGTFRFLRCFYHCFLIARVYQLTLKKGPRKVCCS